MIKILPDQKQEAHPLFYQPSLDVTGLRGEIHTNLENLSRIVREGKRIPLLLNLAQCLLGGTVQLELHHVDIAIGLQNEIDPTL